MPGRKKTKTNKNRFEKHLSITDRCFYIQKGAFKMRYGYDLKNPMDREMYLKMRQREFERANNKDLTLQQAYTEYLKDNQKEMEYFKWRDRQEQEIKKEQQKQKEDFIKEVEEETETAINDIIKSLKFN